MSIRMFLLIDGLRPGLLRRSGKIHREVRSIITQHILPNIVSGMSEELSVEHYPWCFIISGAPQAKQRYCAGAFSLTSGKEGEKQLFVICSVVSASWLQKNMHTKYPLTFWAARILNLAGEKDMASKSWQPLYQWFRALRWAYSPWRQFLLKPTWRFEKQSKMLFREGSQQDYRIAEGDGVGVMPWKNWPDCLQREAGIWIWQQSRHRMVLDSQRISLRHEKTNPADGSF
ncbi:T6SS protein Cts1T [Pantoea agglomerans]|uniref:T6SS protein Cts1T n=1 Tax=Enterobacter agglomerans TaxID=549 RepID=UPI003D2BED96